MPVAEKEPSRAELTQEAVAAPAFPFWGPYVRSLPPWSDELQRDFGLDIYERMLLDPQVCSSLGLLVKSVLEDGVSCSPAIKEGEDRHEDAVELAAFCRRCLERIDPDLLTAVLPDLIEAYGLGHRIAEQVYEVAADGPDRGKLVLKSLKVKPGRALAFVVDRFLNVLGFINSAFPLVTPMPDGATLLPRQKFALLTWGMKDSDPRGRSAFRCIYDAWWRKYQVIGEWLKYLAQFGSGSIFAILPAEVQQSFEFDPMTGELLYETDGVTPKVRNPLAMALAALQAIRSGSAAAFPHGYEVDKLQMQGNGEAFVAALDRCDREIERGILHQTLATGEAQHQARASSQVHQDTLGVVVRFVRVWVAAMLRRDVLKPLVEYNYGAAGLELLPCVALGDTEEQDIPVMLTALGKLGFSVHPSQYQEIDAATGLPRRSDDAVAEDLELRRNPPAPPGGQPPNGKPPADDAPDDGADQDG